jgi:predicted DNA-binding protein (MmcQ/YjbR family)
MSIDHVRRLCLSFPYVTENVQWGADLVFKIAGKLFAVTCLEPSAHVLSFKCTDQEFAALTEQPGIVPAPYMARNKWVSLGAFDVVPKRDLERLLRNSYELVLAKLPKKARAELNGTGQAASKAANRKLSAGKTVREKAAKKADGKSTKARRGR